MTSSNNKPARQVALFVTCLVDLMRPSVGFAALKLLRSAGCDVVIPRSQTCCGQPAYNSGDRKGAAVIARQVVNAFKGYEYVVVPSGSCAATIIRDYPSLLADDSDWASRAKDLASRTHELVSFLVDVMGVERVETSCDSTVTYHDSCSSLRSLGIHSQPRKLLESVDGLELRPLADNEVCCGFGGMFCVNHPEISNEMTEDKARQVEATGATLLLAADLGCLINIAGKLSRMGSGVEVRHVAEVLAGETSHPPIGGATR